MLLAIRPFNKSPHPIPLQIAWESYCQNHLTRCVFTQPGSRADMSTPNCDVRYAIES
jgi:hypothetical protein